MIEIAPSLLGAYDKVVKENNKFVPSEFEKEVNQAIRSGAERLEIDMMDGEFVPRKQTFPLRTIDSLAKKRVLIDIHYMGYIRDEKTIDKIIHDITVNAFSFHYEAAADYRKVADYIRRRGMKASIALNPLTDLSRIQEALQKNLVDEVLLMGVLPGRGGQPIIEDTYNKIADLVKLIPPRSGIKIKIDGGVNEKNAEKLHKYGADVLVIGSAFFNSGDYRGFVDRIRNK